MSFRMRIVAAVALWIGAVASLFAFLMTTDTFEIMLILSALPFLEPYPSCSLLISCVLLLGTMLLTLEATDNRLWVGFWALCFAVGYAASELVEMSGIWLRCVFGICLLWQFILFRSVGVETQWETAIAEHQKKSDNDCG